MTYHIGIIGGGPAGMSAALWLANLGCHPTLFEQASMLGGQANKNYLVNPWVLGFNQSTGLEIAQRFSQHIQSANINTHLNARVLSLTQTPSGFDVLWSSQDTTFKSAFNALLITTGLSPRGVAAINPDTGIEALPPNMIEVGGDAFIDHGSLENHTILIIGGGDNAFENADFVINKGGKAIVLCRSQRTILHHLSKKMLAHQQSGRSEILCPAKLASITHTATTEGSPPLQVYIHTQPPTVLMRRVHRVHLLIGYEPNQPQVILNKNQENAYQINEQGYILVDALGRTSIPKLYAAGDIANPLHPCVVSAISSGAASARAIEQDLNHVSRHLYR